MNKKYDLIIIGSGPAGMSAAIYARRAGFETLMIEKSRITGGQVQFTYDVDNYPGIPNVSGEVLSEKFFKHAEEMGLNISYEEVIEIKSGEEKTVVTDKNIYLTDAVFIAAGAGHRKLEVPGEEELCGMGVSYCATCDGAFFKGLDVCVAGGGDVAVEDALYLSEFCRKVYIIHRRDELRAADILQKKVFQKKNVEVLWNKRIKEICGEDEVSGVKLNDVISGYASVLKVSGVFIAVGIQPNTNSFKHNISLDEQGFIIAGEDTRTSEIGIYAGGDIRTKALRQIVTAAADGANAVYSIGVDKYNL